MDTRQQKKVEDGLALIKRAMPETYKTIQTRAVQQPDTFRLVRQGLRGVPNSFYAVERGHVVGAPFAVTGAVAMVAGQIVQFGFGFLCFWGGCEQEVADGTH